MEVRIINILLQWVKDMKLGRRRAGTQIGLSLAPQLSPMNSALLQGLVSYVPYAFPPTKDRVCY